MFRFLHAADAHIDSPLQGLEQYDGAPVETLRGATRRAFESLVDLALDEEVDLVLLAGDLYDGDWKDFSTGFFFVRQMARLDEAGIPVILIAGNHDAASVLTRHLSLPANVQMLSTRRAETVELQGVPLAVHGRGFPRRKIPESLVPEYPAPLPGRFNIGLLHTSLAGAPGHDTYAPCSLSELTGKGYDYWALGHVHQPQVLARDPWVVFAGNLQGRHIRETGARGCRLVTVNDSLEVIDAAHHSVDVVRWQRVTVDLTGVNETVTALAQVGSALNEALAAAEGRLLAARLILTGATALNDQLRHDPPRLRAGCIGQAQMVDADQIWIEKVVVQTSQRYELADLAARDDLTRIVLESLEAAGSGTLELPDEARVMLETLPPELRSTVAADLAEEDREALLDDVRALVLEALRRRGDGS